MYQSVLTNILKYIHLNCNNQLAMKLKTDAYHGEHKFQQAKYVTHSSDVNVNCHILFSVFA